jgi:hypothetical protein
MFPRILIKHDILDLRDIESLPRLTLVRRACISEALALLADLVCQIEALDVRRQ